MPDMVSKQGDKLTAAKKQKDEMICNEKDTQLRMKMITS